MSAETTDKPVVAKRGRGRPKGSKTKNRLREPGAPKNITQILNAIKNGVLVIRASRRPRHFNLTEAAAEMGICDDQLRALGQEHGVFLPAYRNGKTVIFTDLQLDIISLVMRGRISRDDGLRKWKEVEMRELESIDCYILGESS